MLTQWVSSETRSSFDKLSTVGFHFFQLIFLDLIRQRRYPPLI